MTIKVVNSLITNCFAVIECLAGEARNMRLSEIADRLGLPRSGAHRMLGALCAQGWVEQDPETEFYRLTLKLSVLGHRFLAGTHMIELCQPVLERVAASSRELVRLAVVENAELVTIAHAQGAQGSLICQSRVFPTLPLHVTASGRAWLATLTNEKALELVLAAGLGAADEFGPNAVRSVEALLRELDNTRRRGYGLAVEEAEPGVTAVAVTIRPDGGEAKAVLAIVGPAMRMGEARIAEISRIAQAGATELASLWPLHSLRRATMSPQKAAA